MGKFSYYAVRVGRVPGIYSDWQACMLETGGFPGAVFRGFRTREEAEGWLHAPQTSSFGRAQGTYEGLQVQTGVEGQWNGTGSGRVENAAVVSVRKRARKEDEFWTLRYDGASQGNPGCAGGGCVLEIPGGEVVYEISVGLGIMTNNGAEYMALIHGMRTAVNLGVQSLRVYGDSQLVTCQVNGEWRVGPEMSSFHREVVLLSRHLKMFEIRWVPRAQNYSADGLASVGLLEPVVPFVSEFPEGGSQGDL